MENALQDIPLIYHCPYCSASACSQEKIESHVQEVHDNYKPFKCANCALSFEREEDVLKHIESCNEEQRLKGLKVSSQKETECRDSLLLRCSHCNWSFDNSSLLVKHIKNRHSDPPKKQDDSKVSCPTCNALFPTKSKLGRHYEGVHLKLRPYECQECKIKFSQRATLNKHNKEVHNPDIPVSKVQMSGTQPSTVPSSSGHEASELRESQPPLSSEPEVNLSISPSKLIVSPKIKQKLQSPTTPKEDKPNGIHKDLKISPGNTCTICHKNFSQRSSLNRHLRTVHSIDTNKMMRDRPHAAAAQLDALLSLPKGSHKCFVCDVSFSRLSDLADHNTDLHSDLVLSKNESKFSNDQHEFSQCSVSSSEIHGVPEATGTCIQESHLAFSLPFSGVSTKEIIYRPSEAALALRERTDISSETATVAESLLSLPESVLPFPPPKDDVFTMKPDEEDEPIGADLKQRINELSLALEESDALAIPSKPVASSSTSKSYLDEITLTHFSVNKRFSSHGEPEAEPLRKRQRRDSLPLSKLEESIIPKLRAKRASLPSNVLEGERGRTRGKMPKREISYSDIAANCLDHSKPDDFVEGTFRCMECYTFFYCKKEFESHMDENHRDIRPFKCSKCHSSFKSEKALDIHDAAVHEKLKPHICPKCGTGFGQKASLYRHIKEVNHDLIYCSDCSACFNVKRDLADHINSVHSLLKPFDCDHCVRSFVSKHQRHIHHLTVHEKRRPYKCEQCGAAFGQRGSLHRHMKTVDHKFLPHKCPHCIRAFRKEEDLESHVKCDHSPTALVNSASRMRPFKCPTCKTSFKHEKILHDHVQACHSNDHDIYLCNICSQKFDNEENMNAHIISHHSNVAREQQCNNCKTIFKKKKQLKKHIAYAEQNADSLRCSICKLLFCLNEHLLRHVTESHPIARSSIKEERSDLESILPCSSNLFETMDYASAQSVKHNLELIVDNIKKHSPKKVVHERLKATIIEENSISSAIGNAGTVSLENCTSADRSESQLVNHFPSMIKQEYAEIQQPPSNNNTYEKYLEDVPPSISQYDNDTGTSSTGIKNASSGIHSKFSSKVRYEQSPDKQYTRAVQGDVQYAMGVNPISYGDAPIHRDNYDGVHYVKSYLNQPTNKPIDATNKNFQDSSFSGGSSQYTDPITFMHPKQKALSAPYKSFEQGQTHQQLTFDRKHFDRPQFIIPTTEGTQHPNQVVQTEKICAGVHFNSPGTAVPHHSNIPPKPFISDHQRNQMGHNAEYVDALQSNKPIDASNKSFIGTSEYLDSVASIENPMKFIDMPKGETKNFVINEGSDDYLHSDQLKYVEQMELSNKNFHLNEMTHDSAKYVQTIQKPMDATSKAYMPTTDYEAVQPIKYVEVTTSNGAVVNPQTDQTIKYISKQDIGSKTYSDYHFEPHELNEAVKFVESAVKSSENKGVVEEKSEYYVPVTIKDIHYLVKHSDDQSFDAESLAYAVSVEDLKDHNKMNSMETLYAVALDDVKALEQQEDGGERMANGLSSSQQYAVIIDDTRDNKSMEDAKGPETGAKNYALTLHLVEALEKHVNKNVGEGPKQQISLDHLKMYMSQNYSALTAAGPSSESDTASKDKVNFEGNLQYINEVNGDTILSGTKVLDASNVPVSKDQQLVKTKLTQDIVAAVRDGTSDHFYVQSFLCYDCNVLFSSKESLSTHIETTHQN